jgi:hypothetical protein
MTPRLHLGCTSAAPRLSSRPLYSAEFFIADQLARGRHTAAATSAAAVAADDSGRCEDLYDGFYARLGDAFAALAACHGGRFGVSSNLVGCRYGVSGRANDAEAVDARAGGAAN